MGELYVSTSGAVSRLHQLEIVANNLANVDTLGFKADRTRFQSALVSQVQNPDGVPAAGAPARAFVQTQGVTTDHATGNVVATGRGLDAVIDGPGFFAVETNGGTRYTRAGSFIVDADGTITTLDGKPVLGEGGPIQVGGSVPTILASGAVVDAEDNELGRLRIDTFADPNTLVKEGTNLFRAPTAWPERRRRPPACSLAPSSVPTSRRSVSSPR